MFCKICGNEVHEKAVACPKCGCAVDKVVLNKKEQPKSVKESNITVFKIFNYITIGLISLTFVFFACSIINAYVWTDIYDYTSSNIYARSKFFLSETSLLICLICSICAYGSGTTSFILGFNAKNKGKRFISDVLFIIVNSITFISIYANILN